MCDMVRSACRDTKATKTQSKENLNGIRCAHSTLSVSDESFTDESVNFQAVHVPLLHTNNDGVSHTPQQTNIANVAPDLPGNQKIAPCSNGTFLLRNTGFFDPPTISGYQSDDVLKKISKTNSDIDEREQSTAELARSSEKSALTQSQKTHFGQALDFDQLNIGNGSGSNQEKQKGQMAATSGEFSSNSRDFTHTPDLEFSCGSLSYSTGPCDRESDNRRIEPYGNAVTTKLPFEDNATPHSSGTQMGCSKSSLWSSMASLDLFRVDEVQQHTGAEFGDSNLSMQIGSMNDCSMMIDLASESGEKDSIGRLLASQQFDSSRTLPASNKRKTSTDGLSELFYGSLDFNDSIQDGKNENSIVQLPGVRCQPRVKCVSDAGASISNSSQQNSLEYLQLSVSSEETSASHMSISGIR